MLKDDFCTSQKWVAALISGGAFIRQYMAYMVVF